jgi:hypothetical protein
MKTIYLSDLKVGDKAWDYQLGLVTITEICKDNEYCIETDSGGYTIGGKLWIDDNQPTLFHSEQEFREYWGLQRDTNVPLTKREQFAMAAMQGMLVQPGLSFYTVADLAVNAADALLTKLNEKP